MNDDDDERIPPWGDGLAEQVEQAWRNRAPEDVVPGNDPTLDDLKRQNDLIGTYQWGEYPGEVTPNVDGTPNYVGPTRRERTYVGGVTITTDLVARLGLSVAKFKRECPKIRVRDSATGEEVNE